MKDIPSTIAAHYERFNAMAIPPDATDIQRECLEHAFYAGALAVMNLFWHEVEDSISFSRTCHAVNRECKVYFNGHAIDKKDLQ
jgi:hypothetical protein